MSAAAAIGMEDLRWARAEQAKSGQKLISLIQERTRQSNEAVVAELAAALQIPALGLEGMRIAIPAYDLIPFAEAKKRGCVALRVEGALVVAVADPFDAPLQDWIAETVHAPLGLRICHPLELGAFLAREEEGVRAMDGVRTDSDASGDARSAAQELSLESIGDTESPVVRLVNSTLYDALKLGASDVHLETAASGLLVKYRIDGVLCPVKTIDSLEFADQAVSRIKVMAELDISERRVPQDGRFKARNAGREIDFRVSVMPSVYGEDAVLRVLDKRALSDELKGLTLEQLGFEPGMMRALRRLTGDPYGMVLATGPTGSGKTTTLYAMISEANKGSDKIVTIEDPVEYQLPGVLQIPVNEKKGLTFARGLRSILRHDPDRIMVGEIRDPETAEIAVQAALTGHLVYTTVHANNVFDVIGRFMHMGVDTYNFVSSLNAVLAQRLLRVNCIACAADDEPDPNLIEASGISPVDRNTYAFRRGRGCAVCRGTGYRGRRAIGELLVVNEELRERIVAREPGRKLRECARAVGMASLREAALALVRAGETTLEEINRVTFVAG